jgi:hypothetical protein
LVFPGVAEGREVVFALGSKDSAFDAAKTQLSYDDIVLKISTEK